MKICDLSQMSLEWAEVHTLGIMFFPDDDFERNSFICKRLLAVLSEKITRNSIPDDSPAAFIDLVKIALCVGGVSRLIDFLISKQTNSVRNDVSNNLKNCIFVGRILLYSLENGCSISKSIDSVYESYVNYTEFNDKRYRSSGCENFKKTVWKKYSSAAHLWAAANKFWVENYSSYEIDDEKYIGFQGKLLEFISLAESIRENATTFYPRRQGARQPLLDPEKTYRVIPPRLEILGDKPV